MHSTAFGDSLCEKMSDVDSMICLCIYNSFSFANDAGWVAGKDIGPRVAPLPPLHTRRPFHNNQQFNCELEEVSKEQT